MPDDDYSAPIEIEEDKAEEVDTVEEETAPIVGLLDDEVSDDPVEDPDEFGDAELSEIMYPNGMEGEYSY